MDLFIFKKLTHLKVGPQLREEADRGSILEVAVQVLLEGWFDERGKVGHHARGDRYLREHVHLQETRNIRWQKNFYLVLS